jgi:hypothetical protein
MPALPFSALLPAAAAFAALPAKRQRQRYWRLARSAASATSIIARSVEARRLLIRYVMANCHEDIDGQPCRFRR